MKTIRILALLLAVIGCHPLLGQTLGYSWGQEYPYLWGAGSVTFVEAATDADGNIHSIGFFTGTQDFDPGAGVVSRSASVGTDVFLTSLDSTGSFMQVLIWVSTDSLHLRDFALDSLGNIWLIGQFRGTFDADPGPGVVNLTAPVMLLEGFIIQLDAAGNYLWSGSLEDGTGEVNPTQVATDEVGCAYIAGSYYGTADFDPGPGSISSTADNLAFLLKLTPSGVFHWLRLATGSLDAKAYPIDLEIGDGLIHSTGRFNGSVDFYPGAIDSSVTGGGITTFDSYVFRFDTLGNYVWARAVGGGSTDLPTEVKVNKVTGHVMLCGIFAGSADFDPSPSATHTLAAWMGNTFLLCLSPTGSYNWVRQFAGASGVMNGLVIDSGGNSILSGSFYGTADFDPGLGVKELTSVGAADEYIIKWSPVGNLMWLYTTGGIYDDWSRDMVIDPFDNLFELGQLTAGSDMDPTSLVDAGGPDDFSFIRRMNQGTCAAFSAHFLYVLDPTCDTVGYAVAAGLDGTGPVSFTWSSGALTDTATIDSAGLYVVVATDSVGCTDTSTVLVGGPPTPPAYDFEPEALGYLFRTPAISHLQAIALNHGCVPTDGEFQIILPSGIVLDSCSPVPTAVVGDTVKFAFTALDYSSVVPIHHLFLLDTVNSMGDTICYELRMIPDAGDAFPANNTKLICDTVGAAYDPNDKLVWPRGECDEHFTLLAMPLTYRVRFQNTGTAPAVDVVLMDTLSMSLDTASLVLKATSHDCVAEILPGNILKFRFDGINLPDSATDFDASQGFVLFEARPKPGIPTMTLLENRVGIYFDANPVVMTNTVFNTLVDSIVPCDPLASETAISGEAFTLAPNPAIHEVKVIAGSIWNQGEIQLIDLHGRVLRTLITRGESETVLPLEGIHPGLYLVRITTESSAATMRLLVR